MRTLYGSYLPPSRLVLEVKNRAQYYLPDAQPVLQQWTAKNTWCYEGSFPLDYPLALVQQKIAADLNFYLGLYGRMEKRTMPCLVIVKDTSGNNDSRQHSSDLIIVRAHSMPLNDILFYLNNKYGNMPAFNESGYDALRIVGITKEDCSNIDVLRQKLQPYGLQLIIATHNVDMLVITEVAAK